MTEKRDDRSGMGNPIQKSIRSMIGLHNLGIEKASPDYPVWVDMPKDKGYDIRSTGYDEGWVDAPEKERYNTRPAYRNQSNDPNFMDKVLDLSNRIINERKQAERDSNVKEMNRRTGFNPTNIKPVASTANKKIPDYGTKLSQDYVDFVSRTGKPSKDPSANWGAVTDEIVYEGFTPDLSELSDDDLDAYSKYLEKMKAETGDPVYTIIPGLIDVEYGKRESARRNTNSHMKEMNRRGAKAAYSASERHDRAQKAQEAARRRAEWEKTGIQSEPPEMKMNREYDSMIEERNARDPEYWNTWKSGDKEMIQKSGNEGSTKRVKPADADDISDTGKTNGKQNVQGDWVSQDEAKEVTETNTQPAKNPIKKGLTEDSVPQPPSMYDVSSDDEYWAHDTPADIPKKEPYGLPGKKPEPYGLSGKKPEPYGLHGTADPKYTPPGADYGVFERDTMEPTYDDYEDDDDDDDDMYMFDVGADGSLYKSFDQRVSAGLAYANATGRLPTFNAIMKGDYSGSLATHSQGSGEDSEFDLAERRKAKAMVENEEARLREEAGDLLAPGTKLRNVLGVELDDQQVAELTEQYVKDRIRAFINENQLGRLLYPGDMTKERSDSIFEEQNEELDRYNRWNADDVDANKLRRMSSQDWKERQEGRTGDNYEWKPKKLTLADYLLQAANNKRRHTEAVVDIAEENAKRMKGQALAREARGQHMQNIANQNQKKEEDEAQERADNLARNTAPDFESLNDPARINRELDVEYQKHKYGEEEKKRKRSPEAKAAKYAKKYGPKPQAEDGSSEGSSDEKKPSDEKESPVKNNVGKSVSSFREMMEQSMIEKASDRGYPSPYQVHVSDTLPMADTYRVVSMGDGKDTVDMKPRQADCRKR